MRLEKIIKDLESVIVPYSSMVILEAIRLLKEQNSKIEKLRFTIKTIIDMGLDFSKKEEVKIELLKPKIILKRKEKK